MNKIRLVKLALKPIRDSFTSNTIEISDKSSCLDGYDKVCEFIDKKYDQNIKISIKSEDGEYGLFIKSDNPFAINYLLEIEENFEVKVYQINKSNIRVSENI